MNTSPRPLRIAAADDERDMRQFFQEVLPHLGHEVIVVAGSGRELIERCKGNAPDLIITDIKMSDMDGIEAATSINQEHEVPIILVSAHQDAELLVRAAADHIMAYLMKPVKPADLVMAIKLAMLRFGQYQAVRREAADLRQALEDRKVIERAKGIAMRRMHVDEQEAFRRLRRLASERNIKLVQVARMVLNAEEVFTAMEANDKIPTREHFVAREHYPNKE